MSQKLIRRREQGTIHKNASSLKKGLSTPLNINTNSTATSSIKCSKVERSQSFPNLLAITSGRRNVEKFSKSESDLINITQLQFVQTQMQNSKSEFCLKSISTHTTMPSGRQGMMQQRNDHQDTNKYPSVRDSSKMSNDSSSNRHSLIEYIRVPIVGYEVMEERARFTVYKLRIENPLTNDCWLVLRRYTDFVRLNNKIKTIFPNSSLILPKKKLFGDNFNSVFLDGRIQGLQIYVNTIMANEVLRNCQIVREFFCLDEPPTYSESMEEARAIFEAQEETISHLKLHLKNKDQAMYALEQRLAFEMEEKERYMAAIKNVNENCSKCCKEIQNFMREQPKINMIASPLDHRSEL